MSHTTIGLPVSNRALSIFFFWHPGIFNYFRLSVILISLLYFCYLFVTMQLKKKWKIDKAVFVFHVILTWKWGHRLPWKKAIWVERWVVQVKMISVLQGLRRWWHIWPKVHLSWRIPPVLFRFQGEYCRATSGSAQLILQNMRGSKYLFFGLDKKYCQLQ